MAWGTVPRTRRATVQCVSKTGRRQRAGEIVPPMIYQLTHFPFKAGKKSSSQQSRQSIADDGDFLFPSRSDETRLLRAFAICLGESMVYMYVSLKVCEGCGSLWFRTEGRTEVYCVSCAGKFKSFPVARKSRAGRPRKHTAQALVVAGGTQ